MQDLRRAEASGHHASALSKLEGYAARFALIFHLVNWAASSDREEGLIEPWAVENTIRLAQLFANERERLYGVLAETDRTASRLASTCVNEVSQPPNGFEPLTCGLQNRCSAN